MPRSRSEPSAADGRRRSQTPTDHKKRIACVKSAGTGSNEDQCSHLLYHSIQNNMGQLASIFQNQSAPLVASDSSVLEDTGASNGANAVHGLHNQLCQALYEVDTLRKENKKQEEDITECGDIIGYYKRAVAEKSQECLDLKNELSKLQLQLTPAGQDPVQRLGNFPVASQSTQTPKDKEIAELRLILAECERTNCRLRNERDQLRETKARQDQRILAQTSAFSRELEELKSKAFLTKTPRIPDMEIVAKWKALGFLIRQFISNYFPGSLDPATAHKLVQLKNFQWFPEMAKALQSPFLCPMVLESWIWHFLWLQIFDSQSKFWAGEAGEIIGNACEKIKGT